MKKSIKTLEVRKSAIQGRGVFAARGIAKGQRLIEYKGTRRRWACYDDDQDYVCLFDVGRGLVVDPRQNGNIARYINHSCDPNCEAVLDNGRIYIESLRAIAKGEEITYDYALTFERPPSKRDMERYRCYCRGANCRGTLLQIP